MCFNQPMSAAIGITALSCAALMRRRGKPFRSYCLFLYFGFMEFLQILQYQVADQCSNPINQALTWAAFLHTAFQPLVVNIYFLYGQRSPHPEVGRFVVKLSVAAAVLMLMRTPLLPLTWFGNHLHTWFPDIPTSDTYGKHCHYLEAFCGEQTCSFKGGAWGHIAWSLPLAPATYFLPGAFIHFFMFFVPTLAAGCWVKRILMGSVVFIGPLFCMAFTSSNMATYPYEWPTIWCFFAAVQSFWAVGTELFLYKRGFRPAGCKPPAPQALQSDQKVHSKGTATGIYQLTVDARKCD